MEALNHSSEADFDFYIGSWAVAHRRLKERLAGCTEWAEFAGTSTVQKILGGSGNMDDNFLELPGGPYHAISLRTFNPATRQWLIWWLDGRNPSQLDVPVAGGFANDVGLFYANDVFNQKPIKVRFKWTKPQPNQPRWEQAFSPDAGLTWETNWVMDFTRL